MTEPFKRLVMLVARAFYDDLTFFRDGRSKTGSGDNRGLGVVVLDALTRRQWVREEELARSLKLHSKQLRRVLRFFEEEKLVNRYHRKEIVKSVGDSETAKEGDGKMKIHTHSYCCLDYAQIYDVIRYRLQRMKKKLKDELEGRNKIQGYLCPNCGRRYSAFDAFQLISPEDDSFHCEHCNGELIAEIEKIIDEEDGGQDENFQKRRNDRLREMLQKMDDQLKPLTAQLTRMKDLPVPDFGTLQSWEARVNAARRASTGAVHVEDFSKSVQVHGFGAAPASCVGEVEVRILGADECEEVNVVDVKKSTITKIAPPWMAKQQTRVSHGEEAEASTSSALVENEGDETKEISRSVQEEYVKAFYEAYARMQMEQVAEVNATTAQRELGGKSKRGSLNLKKMWLKRTRMKN